MTTPLSAQNGWIWTWVVSADFQGQRLDRALSQAISQGAGQWEPPHPTAQETLSRNQITRAITENRVTLRSAQNQTPLPLRSALPLETGMEIRLHLPPLQRLDLKPEPQNLSILFEDEHLMIVNKPPGLTVHPSATQATGTLVHALLAHSAQWSGIGGVLRPGIVHRIDKNTSGALAITKTDAAHLKLSEIFAQHAIQRTYWALAYGRVAPASKRIETWIGRSASDRKKMTVYPNAGSKEGPKAARKAITWIRGLEQYGVYASLVEARLETGRTHQVRVHLTAEHHSILGDPVYGTPTATAPKWKAIPPKIRPFITALPGQALHARTLGFNHPITGAEIFVQAPLYPEMEALLAALRQTAHDT